jgi:transglutaminase-like putative cysteine protease
MDSCIIYYKGVFLSMNEILVFTSGHAKQTGDYMRMMVDKFYTDMAPYAAFSLPEVYNLIKSLPYREDPEEAEVLMRPLYTMRMQGYGGDCDDKAIALASYCRLSGIPYRFIAVRDFHRNTLHHVYCQCYITSRVDPTGKWITLDPTYSFCSLGRERKRYAQYAIN